MPVAVRPAIRWLMVSDYPEVLEIEGLCFSRPWSEADFQRTLRQRNCIGLVATAKRSTFDLGQPPVVGYVVYMLDKSNLFILNLAVMPAWQRQGVGQAILEKLQEKCGRRRAITIDVFDANLDGQLFLKACRFKCIAILRDEYLETGVQGDAYRFFWTRD